MSVAEPPHYLAYLLIFLIVFLRTFFSSYLTLASHLSPPCSAPSRGPLCSIPSPQSELAMVDERKAIVFVNTKRQCDYVYGQLEELGYRCTVLHGGKSQDQREAGIKGFREGKRPLVPLWPPPCPLLLPAAST